ncbi:Na+/H+ antiporter NhaC family protein [Gordonibacter urolithinfaciens]|uniref:Sodium:proton antiporter n=1 Tax=Gordonibacter urolithinfaciens TaxID=1335613 RepID=A0A6N8IIG5_9ACTN|nr:Na+/H+ antiporter NhaC family protein [Gordonibacter urolithinfaciens]MVM54046.1 sodium:proton antiporter [Gordonibacter urolithinfaciens]MVN15170.1 sodium:proton antiporter [Gordonibacter urolithinfaciens]MVN38239.1 sodium:proton antiporter [Gordonibacter urolithinfaciens]MVN55078.1 sodium:proton antiporter [Gordonibacter urolithinfaciens]MVN60668.1 sodium:proton antiporter [Gordonibacter urolithinfaciens]
MEGFDLISTGVWSIIPPILALALALITKEVYSSLAIGVFTGMVIYQFSLNGAGFEQLVDSFTMVPQMMAEQIAGNGALLLFLALLGALVVVIAGAGGSRAYGEWVATHIKNAKMAQILTAVLGIIIFVDDYFNCLTVGAVMRPVTDRFKISHEKLAWIIDSTAAPICIIAPVSSWAVAVGGYLGEGGFTTFVQSIPYNFYALLTIVFVFFMCATKKDFGPMRVAEAEFQDEGAKQDIPPKDSALEAMATVGLSDREAADTLPPFNMETVVAERDELDEAAQTAVEEFKGIAISERGRVFDLIVPIVVLIIFSILGMLYAGGFFKGVDFATAVGENPVFGLCIGVCVSLVVAAIMFLPRKLMTLSGYMEGISEGVRSMVGAIMILVLAWSLGGTCRYLLGTGEFVSGFLNSIGVGLALLPAVIFVVAAFIGFAMGTSWGTIALILPIVIGVFPADNPLFLVAIGATLGGAVYGDHVSPISDTTILSSAGAQCNHLRHVATQLPYASVVAVICLVGYLIAGFTGNPWISLAVGAVLMVAAVLVLNKSRYGALKD